jgi:hypothetical protein
MSGPFDDLVRDLNTLYRERERELTYVGAVEAEEVYTIDLLAKSIANWPAERAELERRTAALQANAVQMAQQTPLEQAAIRRRKIAAHRENVRAAIPTLLSKALDIQSRGGCTALDVAKVQAECHHLAAAWL